MLTVLGVLPGFLSLKGDYRALKYAGREPTCHGGRDLNMAERKLKTSVSKTFWLLSQRPKGNKRKLKRALRQ